LNDFDSRDDFESADVSKAPSESEEIQRLGTLSLTKNETLYLDEQLTLMIEDTWATLRPVAATGGGCAPMDLIDRVGLAFLWVTDPENLDPKGTISVSKYDLYTLREIARNGAIVDGEWVGLNLKRKIYQLLLDETYQKQKSINRLLSSLPEELFVNLPRMPHSEHNDVEGKSR
jgi:hypothetical protein